MKFRYPGLLMVFIAFLINISGAWAGVEPYSNHLKGQLKKGDTLIVKDEKFRNPLFNWSTIRNKSVYNVINLKIHQDSSYALTKTFTYKVGLKVEYYSQPDQYSPISVNNVWLTVDYKPDSGAVYKAMDTYQFKNGYYVKITIDSISSPELGDKVPSVFELESQVIVDRQYEFKPAEKIKAKGWMKQDNSLQNKNNTDLFASTLSSGTSAIVNAQLNLAWDQIPGAEEYDVEYAVFDTDTPEGGMVNGLKNGSITNPTPETMESLFRNNATRITTNENTYKVSLVFNADLIFVRIRQVAYQQDGELTVRQEGEWDYRDNSNVFTIWDISGLWHESNLNWQYTGTFVEDGKKKEVVSYFDGSLRSRQVVTLNNSNATALVQETVYDEFGRPAINILPAPVKDQTTLRFFPSFNQAATGGGNVPYNYTHLNPSGNPQVCSPVPFALSNTSGAGKYYSPGNDFSAAGQSLFNKYIPDAEGFPFSVTQYTRDNSGRVAVQGGVGPVFQPGTTTEGLNRATNYYYGKPEQWELDRLFGNDVGYAEHYQKNMVRDANGQYSVSYINASGKTIATALAGEAPANLEALSSKGSPRTQTMHLLTPSRFRYDPVAMKLSAATTYMTATPGSVSFSYDIEQLIYKYTSVNTQICSNCYYLLTISIKDECGNVVTEQVKDLPIGATEANCSLTNNRTGSFAYNITAPGTYYISFDLALDLNTIERYTDTYINQRKNNNDLKTEFDFVLENLPLNEVLPCFSECKTCAKDLGTKENFVARIRQKLMADGIVFNGNDESTFTAYANGLYDQLLANCQALAVTCIESPCDNLKRMMLEDVSPGGQYALFDQSSGSPLEQELNVIWLNWRTEFPTTQSPTSEAYLQSRIDLEDGTVIYPYDNSFTLQQLVQYWKDEWAEKFLKYHPEYCKLEFCNNHQSYYTWDAKVEAIEKAQDINTLPNASGLSYQRNDPDWLLQADPFFALGAPGAGYRSQFQEDLEQYSQKVLKIPGTTAVNKSITAYIDFTLYCSDPAGNTQSGDPMNAWNTCAPVESCRVLDKEWQLYKDMYLSQKEKYYDLVRKNTTCANVCEVGDPVLYGLPGACPPANDFIFEKQILSEQSALCPGQQAVLLTYRNGKYSLRSVTISVYYPLSAAEISNLNLPQSFTFAPGEAQKQFCLPVSIPVQGLKVSAVVCGTAGTPPSLSCPGVAGELRLLSGGRQIATNVFEETNTATNQRHTYYIVPGQASVVPQDNQYCTNGTVTAKQFYTCYKVYLPGVAIPIQYDNVWVIRCTLDLCSGTTNTLYVSGNPSTNVYTDANGTYYVYPNTTSNQILTTTYCTNATRSWVSCLFINLNGSQTTTIYNATVFYCQNVNQDPCQYAPIFDVNDRVNFTTFIYSYQETGCSGFNQSFEVYDGMGTSYPGFTPYCYYPNATGNWVYYECVKFRIDGQIFTYNDTWVWECYQYYNNCGGGGGGGGGCEYLQTSTYRTVKKSKDINALIIDPCQVTVSLYSQKQADEQLVTEFGNTNVYLVKTDLAKTESQRKSPAARKYFTKWEYKDFFYIQLDSGVFRNYHKVWIAKADWSQFPSSIPKSVGRREPRLGPNVKKVDPSNKINRTVTGASYSVASSCYPSTDFFLNEENRYVSNPTCNTELFDLYVSRPAGAVTVDVKLWVDLIQYYEQGPMVSTLEVTIPAGSNQAFVATLEYTPYNPYQYCPEATYQYSIASLEPVCLTPAGNCPPALRYKKARVLPYAEGGGTGFTESDLQQEQLANEAKVVELIKTNCEGQADTWMAQLADCLSGYPQATKDLLRQRLIEVCIKGGDKSRLFGSSTTPDGTTTAAGFNSFEQVIRQVLGISSLSMTCNPWLIDAPVPFNQPQQNVEKLISNTNEAICARLTTLENQRLASAPGKTLYQYLVDTYGTAMKLSFAELEALRKSCNNCRFLLEKDLVIPVFMEPGAKGCINKAEYDAALAALNGAMAPNTLASSHPNYETILSNFLNHRFGLALPYYRYKEFADQLAGNPNAILCNEPPYTSVEGPDPYGCLMDMVTTAVMNGRNQYMEYISEVRREFQVNYINTCSLAKSRLSATGNQHYYHYTLYYYDQAGNLVRTVPPQGVKPLENAEELDKVSLYRDYQASLAAYTGPLANTDKNASLLSLSQVLGGTGNHAVELWLYNNQPNQGRIITGTPDNGFLYNTCVNGNRLNIDIYKYTLPQAGALELQASNHLTVDLSGLTLTNWLHIVLQGNTLLSGNLQVYVNGSLRSAIAGAPDAGCGFELTAANPIVLPEELGALKHMRLYTRLLSAGEISGNYANGSMGIDPANAGGLYYWARFNTPAEGSYTTNDDFSTVESRYQPVYPTHLMTTNYVYNSTGQVVEQKSPDGGRSKFWYDWLGRLVASQNEEQLNPAASGAQSNRYSYTRYDALGRITEVGEKLGATLPAAGYLDQSAINSFLAAGSNQQITQTYYDVQPAAVNGLSAVPVLKHLRKRVAVSAYRATAGGPVQSASYYSYDLMGNVRNLWQQVPGLGLKRIDYEYDLASGKVNFVAYQAGSVDQFFHQYAYDVENRLTEVRTGINALLQPQGGSTLINGKTDARYFYYPHGPLARMELSDPIVQGVDYSYTLQGWLKGINGYQLSALGDMNQDGKDNNAAPRDVMAFSLGYYQGDFKGVGSGANAFATTLTTDINNPAHTGHSLFNGNIRYMTLAVQQLDNGSGVRGYTYRYDQLNRLVQRRHQTNVTANWLPGLGNGYAERFVYDANGNLQTSYRWKKDGVQIDELDGNFEYLRTSGQKGYYKTTSPLPPDVWELTNRMASVTDSKGSFGTAIGDMANQTQLDNYQYDRIGNLIRDQQENLSSISWTVYGKIASIRKTDNSEITYQYDPTGNRIAKTAGGVTTWYVRDAQGNTMAVYTDKEEGQSGLYWQEQHLYGSSRLGMYTPKLNIATAGSNTVWGITGRKLFELSNHLGNVLATVSDKRIGVDPGGDGTVDYYTAEVLSAQDYYSFGWQTNDNKFLLGGAKVYRYGFNGKENDNEVKGEGNQQDYGMRIYDPRISRFLSVDPITAKYPELTPYQFASNSPIWAIDLDGLEGLIATGMPLGNSGHGHGMIVSPEMARKINQEHPEVARGLVVGLAVAVDVFITKGWVTRTLFASQVFGAAEHNRATTPEGRTAQNQRSREAIADAIFTYGAGKILGVTFNVGTSVISKLARNRFNFARNYYKSAGYNEERTLSHTKGIDLSQKVYEETYKKGTVLEQWTYIDDTGKPIMGDYFALPGADPNKLGIPLTSRVKTTVVLTEDTKFLRSTAGDIENWNKPGEILKGGETQLFQTNVKYEIKK
ncbi:hypothetical protein KJS94_12335 [Flavihumibacter rivuli]|uniref:RHS repeat-associated core domain-containing protein n=1 Tax=Flavihumibacter rivuli TaxID=2838156 RepID=UPI001BDF112B|nr:RHS repeat-associated core domain-containing protein [Flavihumibacter rivuli]ULQ55430.1 hypothetical protein KJS94_12335 [Flavihumibacter rivuli]